MSKPLIEQSEWQEARIGMFVEQCVLCDRKTARAYLEFYEWNIFSALDNYHADNRHD